MRRLLLGVLFIALGGIGASTIPNVRAQVRALVRPEPPAEITPLAFSVPAPVAGTDSAEDTQEQQEDLKVVAAATAQPTTVARTPTRKNPTPIRNPRVTATSVVRSPTPVPQPTKVVVHGRSYDAYIPAATKKSQAYQYSCEFDAAWVILQTYGLNVNVDQLIGLVGVDASIEPYIKETEQGFLIYGGDITKAFSGDYRKNFLARSSGAAVRKAFEHYGLRTTAVHDRAGIEAALRSGSLVWMKTTVDFKSWRPATWIMPDGRTQRTVLGNDHAVVVMGYNAESVVIRDVLGPTSSNRQRPYEYEVRWTTFLKAWEAQAFDGLAVAPARTGR